MNATGRIMFGSEMFQRNIEFMVHRKGHLEDLESTVLEHGLLLIFDRFLEGADRLGAGEFDRKDVTGN